MCSCASSTDHQFSPECCYCVWHPHYNPHVVTTTRELRQITKSARLEEIRLTILNNLMLYHPESTGELAWGPPASSSRDYESDSEGSGRPALGVRSRCLSAPRVGRDI